MRPVDALIAVLCALSLARRPDEYLRARRCACGGYWWTEARNAPHRRGSPGCYLRRGSE